MEMSHGDAIVILRTATSSKKEKYEAMKVIFEGDYEYDYNCFTKPHLWQLVRFMYQEMKKAQEVSFR